MVSCRHCDIKRTVGWVSDDVKCRQSGLDQYRGHEAGQSRRSVSDEDHCHDSGKLTIKFSIEFNNGFTIDVCVSQEFGEYFDECVEQQQCLHQ